MSQKLRAHLENLLKNDEVFTAALLVLVALTSFGLGRSSVEVRSAPAAVSHAERTLQKTEKEVSTRATSYASSSSMGTTQGTYVASVNGSRYHLPECPGAQSIKEENKVWFQNKADAERAGYTPAQNCDGL